MDTRVADTLIGALVDGRYRVRGRIARGAMATVYTATDERLERTVALKIIHPAQSGDPDFVARFIDEARTIARLTHPNVVAVYDQGSHQGLPYLVLEYVRGHTLREVLAQRRRLGAVDALSVMEQVLAAVAAAHRAGLIHRDIKPENVLIAEAPHGDGLVDSVVKVADFGLARAVEEAADDSAHLLATVAYVAPELVTDGRADPRTDVYSAGIMLFEMLTGRVPYEGDRPVEVAWQHVDHDVPAPSMLVPGLPGAVDEVVARATRRDPGARPTDAGAMLSEVQSAREDIGTAAAGARAAAAPTVRVRSIDPPTRAMSTERPPWARLPGAGTARPGAGRRRARRYPAGPGRLGAELAGYYRRVTRTAQGRRAVAAAIVVLGLLVAVGGWWFGMGRYTQAPALTGLNQAQAQVVATQNGFTVRTDGGRFDEKVARGTVLDQHPGQGQRIVRGGTITLTLSKGPERYTVPDENGKSYEDAVADLSSFTLVPKRVDVYSDVMPAGNAISTVPPAGTVVKPHTEIAVNVSKGKAPNPMPNLVGVDAAAAKAQLDGMHLDLVVAFTQKQSDKPANQVLEQSVEPGTNLDRGANVILTISTGPPLVAVPDLSNMDLNQANQTLQALGLTIDVKINLGGHVHQQQPAPGTQVPPGSPVSVWSFPP